MGASWNCHCTRTHLLWAFTALAGDMDQACACGADSRARCHLAPSCRTAHCCCLSAPLPPHCCAARWRARRRLRLPPCPPGCRRAQLKLFIPPCCEAYRLNIDMATPTPSHLFCLALSAASPTPAALRHLADIFRAKEHFASACANMAAAAFIGSMKKGFLRERTLHGCGYFSGAYPAWRWRKSLTTVATLALPGSMRALSLSYHGSLVLLS